MPTATFDQPRTASRPTPAASRLSDRQIVRPLPGDTQPNFAIRFHSSMLRLIPSTSERQRLCQQIWRASENGDHTVEDMVAERWPDSAQTVRDVCEFGEHTLKLPNRVEKYDARVLSSIVQNCNSRIRDSHDYACLCDDHTPPDEALQAGAKSPAVLGHIGPFFLGMIGEDQPRWAIFGDEHWLPTAFPQRAQYARRSAELFRFDERGQWIDTANRFIDPVAALGSKTPALNLGTVKYAAGAIGSRRVCYSGDALPSSTNCFVAGDDTTGKKAKYDDQNVGGNAMDPETIQQVAQVCVQAIMQSKPMQWVISQMPADGSADPGADPNASAMGGDPNADLNADPNAMGDADPNAAPGGDGLPDAPPTEAAPAPAAPPDDKTQYTHDTMPAASVAPAAAAAPTGDADEQAFVATLTPQQAAMFAKLKAKDDAPAGGGAAQYSLVSQFNEQLRQQNASLAATAATATKLADSSYFEGTLSVLKYRDGYDFDERDMLAKCAQYGRKQFDDLVNIIKRHSPRVPLASACAPLPTPDLERPRSDPGQQATEQQVSLAAQYCRQQRQTNARYTFDAALAHVLKN